MKIVNKITKDGIKRKSEIDFYKKDILSIQDKISDLMSTCDHELIRLSSSQMRDRWMSISARCMICGKYFGWRCKKSPDSVCHHVSFDGKVVLIDGTLVNIPKNHKPEQESGNGCIFCGMPDERKYL